MNVGDRRSADQLLRCEAQNRAARRGDETTDAIKPDADDHIVRMIGKQAILALAVRDAARRLLTLHENRRDRHFGDDDHGQEDVEIELPLRQIGELCRDRPDAAQRLHRGDRRDDNDAHRRAEQAQAKRRQRQGGKYQEQRGDVGNFEDEERHAGDDSRDRHDLITAARPYQVPPACDAADEE